MLFSNKILVIILVSFSNSFGCIFLSGICNKVKVYMVTNSKQIIDKIYRVSNYLFVLKLSITIQVFYIYNKNNHRCIDANYIGWIQ